jgi:hypothetical protein
MIQLSSLAGVLANARDIITRQFRVASANNFHRSVLTAFAQFLVQGS